MDFDVIIVGAGVAGSSLAGLLGQAGARALLLDKAAFPRPKPCGQGILPHGVKALEKMGALSAVMPLGNKLLGLTYHAQQNSSHICFGADIGFGLGVERAKLDFALIQWALTNPSISFEEKTTFEAPLMEGARVAGVVVRSSKGNKATWRAPVIVFADGLHSIARRSLGIGVHWPPLNRFGTVAYLDRLEQVENSVEVFLAEKFEVYITPLPDKVCVAILHGKELLNSLESSNREKTFFNFLGRVNALGPRLSRSACVGPVLQWGPLAPKVNPIYGDGFVLTGDAGGAADPITGEGMALAFRVALQICPVILQAIARGGQAASLAACQNIYAKETRNAVKLAGLVRRLSRHGWLAQRVVRNLGRHPGLFEELLRVATGQIQYESIGWLTKIKLVC
ncbi:MAG: NAD(P)/FAD-dependent oxidoreductase [Elusimicrobiota bacterium]